MDNLQKWLSLKRLKYESDAIVFGHQAKTYIEEWIDKVLAANKNLVSSGETAAHKNLSKAVEENIDLFPNSFKEHLPVLIALLDRFAIVDIVHADRRGDSRETYDNPSIEEMFKEQEKNIDVVLDLIKPS